MTVKPTKATKQERTIAKKTSTKVTRKNQTSAKGTTSKKTAGSAAVAVRWAMGGNDGWMT